jgi:hypothetical protein
VQRLDGKRQFGLSPRKSRLYHYHEFEILKFKQVVDKPSRCSALAHVNEAVRWLLNRVSG